MTKDQWKLIEWLLTDYIDGYESWVEENDGEERGDEVEVELARKTLRLRESAWRTPRGEESRESHLDPRMPWVR